MYTHTHAHTQAQRHSNLELDQDVVELLDPTKKPDPEVCAQDLIDFSPVYRCLHIHSVLVSIAHGTGGSRLATTVAHVAYYIHVLRTLMHVITLKGQLSRICDIWRN